jgi:hypothetical protein
MSAEEAFQEWKEQQARYAEQEAALYQSKLKCEELYNEWERLWRKEWEAARNASRNSGCLCPLMQVSDCQV